MESISTKLHVVCVQCIKMWHTGRAVDRSSLNISISVFEIASNFFIIFYLLEIVVIKNIINVYSKCYFTVKCFLKRKQVKHNFGGAN